MPDTNWDGDVEEIFPVAEEEIDPSRIDPETGGLLPDKYNYLKIENVFSGKILGSDKLFSIEVALLTRQPTIASDLFISALYEMEGDLIAEITTVILEVSAEQLLAYHGRENLSLAIRGFIRLLKILPSVAKKFKMVMIGITGWSNENEKLYKEL